MTALHAVGRTPPTDAGHLAAVPGSGHDPPVHHPEEVLEPVLPFPHGATREQDSTGPTGSAGSAGATGSTGGARA